MFILVKNCLIYLRLSIFIINRLSLFSPQPKVLGAVKRESVVFLDDISSELIDIFELVHLIDDGIVPSRPVVLVEEDSEQQRLFSVLV